MGSLPALPGAAQWAVYGWSTYEDGSVLEGQTRKVWLEAHEDHDAACRRADTLERQAAAHA